jgi:hypothetical protein
MSSPLRAAREAPKTYVLRDTGAGAYIDGPFWKASSVNARVNEYHRLGWTCVVIRAASRADALGKFGERRL